MTSPIQLKYLKAMGIPVWVSRDRIVRQDNQDEAEQAKKQEEPPRTDSASRILDTLEEYKSGSATGVETARTQAKHPHEKVSESAVNTPDCTQMDWQALQQNVELCSQCDLHHTRTQTVFGSGNRQASWMIVGEAPGADEDRQGQPFVGRAGQLLNNMLDAIGLVRDEVYITNVLKCRPPNNRDPGVAEVTACKPYLLRQIELVSPKLLLVVGRVAAQNLLQTKEPLARLRGKVHQLPASQIPLIVTYHPAYLLRKPIDKRKAWDDLKLARGLFENHIHTK